MKHYTKEEILAALRLGDPHLTIVSEEERKRILTDPVLETARADLQDLADDLGKHPTMEIPFSLFRRFDADGDRTQYEYAKNGYFIRRGKLAAHAILAWLYGREGDIAALEDIIWAILNEYTWCLPAHITPKSLARAEENGYTVDLFAAETGQALAEILTLVGDRLHPLIVERVRVMLERRIFQPIENDLQRFWWRSVTNNWSAVCAGSCGVCAMYEIRDEQRLSSILYDMLGAMECFLRGFSEDGACLEGISYWQYGFGYFTVFADLLKKRTAGAIDLFRDEKVARVAAFQQKALFAGGLALPFSDTNGRSRYSLPMLGILCAEYPDMPVPSREDVGLEFNRNHTTNCYRFALCLRHFLWSKIDFSENKEHAASVYALPDAQWYVATAENGTGFAAKAGTNTEPHNHNDVGNFVICRNGRPLLWEMGSREYTKQYFGSARYQFIETSSRGHSVPIIGDVLQSEGTRAKDGKVSLTGESVGAGGVFGATNVEIGEDGFCADIAGAYDTDRLRSLVRRLAFDRKNGDVALCDTYDFAYAPETITERFISMQKPIVDGNTVILENGGERLYIRSCDGLSPVVTEDTHRTTTETMPVYLIDFVACPTGDALSLRFAFTAEK